MNLLGIFGGTFDPVHFGHLRPALDVKQNLQLERMLFIPNQVLPGKQPLLSAEQRKELVQLAIAGLPGFELDTRELDRDGMSYMVDTLVSLNQDYPDQALVLVVGMDAFAGLYQWHQWTRILDLCHLVVTTRPGFVWPEVEEMRSLRSALVDSVDEMRKIKSGRILLQSVIQLDISSSYIRKQLQEGYDIRYLLPEGVRVRLLEMVKES